MTKSEMLSPDLDAFVHDMVATGRYASAAEVIAEGLHLLQAREEARKAGREGVWSSQAWREGIESGPPVEADEVFDRLVAKYDSLAKARRV